MSRKTKEKEKERASGGNATSNWLAPFLIKSWRELLSFSSFSLIKTIIAQKCSVVVGILGNSEVVPLFRSLPMDQCVLEPLMAHPMTRITHFKIMEKIHIFQSTKLTHWLLTFLSKSVTRKALPMKCFYISLRKMLQKYIFAFHQEVYLVVVECVESICLTFTLNIDDRIIWMLFNQCKCFLMMARASGFRQVASRGDPRSRGSSVSHQEHRLPNPG